MKKVVSIYPTAPITSVNPPIRSSVRNVTKSIDAIRKCIIARARVYETLNSGEKLLLDLTNYDKDNNASPVTEPVKVEPDTIKEPNKSEQQPNKGFNNNNNNKKNKWNNNNNNNKFNNSQIKPIPVVNKQQPTESLIPENKDNNKVEESKQETSTVVEPVKVEEPEKPTENNKVEESKKEETNNVAEPTKVEEDKK